MAKFDRALSSIEKGQIYKIGKSEYLKVLSVEKDKDGQRVRTNIGNISQRDFAGHILSKKVKLDVSKTQKAFAKIFAETKSEVKELYKDYSGLFDKWAAVNREWRSQVADNQNLENTARYNTEASIKHMMKAVNAAVQKSGSNINLIASSKIQIDYTASGSTITHTRYSEPTEINKDLFKSLFEKISRRINPKGAINQYKSHIDGLSFQKNTLSHYMGELNTTIPKMENEIKQMQELAEHAKQEIKDGKYFNDWLKDKLEPALTSLGLDAKKVIAESMDALDAPSAPPPSQFQDFDLTL